MSNDPQNNEPQNHEPTGNESPGYDPQINSPEGGDSQYGESFDNTESAFGSTGPAVGTLPPPPAAPAVPVGGPYRRWNRPALFFGIVAAILMSLLVAVVGLLVIGIAAVAAVASGDLDIDTVEVEHVPATLADLPESIVVDDKVDMQIDLTELDLDQIDNAGGPYQVDVRGEVGSIKVIVPEGLNVSVDAEADIGEVVVFGKSSSGFGPTVVDTVVDPDLDIELDLNVGQIEVVKG